MDDVLALLEAADAAGQLADIVEYDMGSHVQWTPPQHALHTCTSKKKLLRTGNQFGKTWAGVKEVDWHCTGKHPHIDVRDPPVEWWIVCSSWKQSVYIQGKFYDLCDKEEVEPRYLAKFDREQGFRHANPVVLYKNGSIIRFKTTGQGAREHAGATIDGVLIDEPTVQRVYNELAKRLSRTGGTMILTLTPINAKVEYLQELCAKGIVTDLHFRMEPRNFIPVGRTEPIRTKDGSPIDAEWIKAERESTLGFEAPIIIDGEWESRSDGIAFTRFSRREHVTIAMPQVDMTLMLFCIGIDHGSRDFKQSVILAAYIPEDALAGRHASLHVLAEYNGDGATLPEQDAAGALALLSRWGLSWSRDKATGLHSAHGDHPHDAGRVRSKIGRKTNAEFQAEVGKQLGLTAGRVYPPVRRVKVGKGGGRGSVYVGCKWLHRLMLRPGCFTVHPSCEKLIESFEKWDYSDDEWKDSIDGLRYATWDFAMKGKRRRGAPKLYIPS